MVIFSTLDIPAWLAVLPIFGIAPWLGKALLGIGGGLLKGIFGGKAKKQEREQRFKTYERLRTSRRPDKPYSRGIDPVVQQAIANIFRSRGMADPYAGAGQTKQAPTGGRLGGGRVRRPRRRDRGGRL